jgi:hypothetical protein
MWMFMIVGDVTAILGTGVFSADLTDLQKSHGLIKFSRQFENPMDDCDTDMIFTIRYRR